MFNITEEASSCLRFHITLDAQLMLKAVKVKRTTIWAVSKAESVHSVAPRCAVTVEPHDFRGVTTGTSELHWTWKCAWTVMLDGRWSEIFWPRVWDVFKRKHTSVKRGRWSRTKMGLVGFSFNIQHPSVTDQIKSPVLLYSYRVCARGPSGHFDSDPCWRLTPTVGCNIS